jgi:hypothetical protein
MEPVTVAPPSTPMPATPPAPAAAAYGGGEQTFTPPLPAVVMRVLACARLCYLATCEDSSPHLSLMRYTFVEDAARGCVLLMSSRKDTRKVAFLTANPRVAVLLHDFDDGSGTGSTSSSGGSGGGAGEGVPRSTRNTASVTVYGHVELLEDGPEADRLRAAHLANNPGYAQFITGPGMVLMALTPTLARIANIQDRVETWESPCPGRPVRSSSWASSEEGAAGSGGGGGSEGGGGGGGGAAAPPA